MTPAQVLLAYEDGLQYLMLIHGGSDDASGNSTGPVGPEPSIEKLTTFDGIHLGVTVHKDELPLHLREFVNDALEGGKI